MLLDFADKSIGNRRFPDKGIDLLQQAVAQALVDGRKTVDTRRRPRHHRELVGARLVDADAGALRA